ncbi:MAG: hypothetical protein U0X75_10985 [Acidobacteriota bacterium]
MSISKEKAFLAQRAFRMLRAVKATGFFKQVFAAQLKVFTVKATFFLIGACPLSFPPRSLTPGNSFLLSFPIT